MIEKNILILCISCLIFSCNGSYDEKNTIDPQRLSDVTYFHPTIEVETQSSGETKNGIRLNPWSYRAGKEVDFTIDWGYYSISDFNLMIPDSSVIDSIQGAESIIYKLVSKSGDYEFYVFNDSIDINKESSKSQYLLKEMAGIIQVCLEDDLCEVGVKNANYFEFKATDLILFSYEEIISDNQYLRLGGLVLLNNRMYYLTSRTPNKEYYVLKNKIIFSEIFNHIKKGNKYIIPTSLELLKAEPINFTNE